MSNLTFEAVSKQSGVSAKQIFDWLNQPPFRQELERRKNEAVDQAVDRLKLTANKACDMLITCLQCTIRFDQTLRCGAYAKHDAQIYGV